MSYFLLSKYLKRLTTKYFTITNIIFTNIILNIINNSILFLNVLHPQHI